MSGHLPDMPTPEGADTADTTLKGCPHVRPVDTQRSQNSPWAEFSERPPPVPRISRLEAAALSVRAAAAAARIFAPAPGELAKRCADALKADGAAARSRGPDRSEIERLEAIEALHASGRLRQVLHASLDPEDRARRDRILAAAGDVDALRRLRTALSDATRGEGDNGR